MSITQKIFCGYRRQHCQRHRCTRAGACAGRTFNTSVRQSPWAGGRLATRRVEWVDRQGHAATTRLDRGVLGFTASSAAFQAFVDLVLQAGGVRHTSKIDKVVLALPPAQTTPLFSPHRIDWARHAAIAPMQPCWTLMGVADDPEPESGWDLARPRSGLLGWVLRNASFRRNKAALPSRPGVACGLAMSWRRRWARIWAKVKYCSDGCRRTGVSHG